jgi:ATP-dependent protease HslVU (ClpYQ) peptidase subunit
LTTIVAYISKEENRVYMASDSVGANNIYREYRKDPKILAIPDENPVMLIGFAGSPTVIQAIQMANIAPPPDSKWGTMLGFIMGIIHPQLEPLFDTNDFDFECLIAFDGKIFGIQNNFALSELVNNYNAIGTGRDYALGAMFACDKNPVLSAKDKVTLAIDAASENDIKSGGKVQIRYI